MASMKSVGGKADPRLIIRAHRRTYVSANTRQPRVRDILLMEILPLGAGVLVFLADVQLKPQTCAALLAVSGLLAGLLFGVMLQVSGRAMDWADSTPARGGATSRHANVLEELAANAGYASLICIASAVAYLATSLCSPGLPRRVGSSVSIALSVHLILVLLMVMRRVFALTQERLNRARTGADRIEDGSGRVQ